MLRGFAITSGGARGTDAISHRQAMLRQRPTIVVAGTGADTVYPAENRDIFEYAILHGAVVSPFPSGTGGRRPNFPMRNAVIAALCAAVIVVQCREGSGALYTANYATQMGIPVMVPTLPGFCDLTEGSLNLARSGKAGWITRAADLDQIGHSRTELNGVQRTLDLSIIQRNDNLTRPTIPENVQSIEAVSDAQLSELAKVVLKILNNHQLLNNL